ncbi:putative histone acetyltransferase (MysT1) [Aspergillus saccharolyticus JOP 1030-1]|uniref:histone acetyltransferase n=1 Tax=Aspergillus saccharolyticus JOP 1030-1 TaxID=1450539 RepID=A0A318ZB11_9EURO|nr:acyl-CoA N-acyltransferase [Aspergillus saccharolyticus JOP 1030-1]PYH41903.1 acyl-CoA N-acyltransferase [Aspergillus saccharolyticus JOP 1030-1]
MAANDPATRAEPSSTTDRNVKHVVLGNLLFQTWYQSIYPEDLVSKDTDRLYVCRWCFRYSCDAHAYTKHTRLCPHRQSPPGVKVYEQGGYSVWELDGEHHKLYAQNLSLFAKLFLDHKSVFFDVVSFLYYLLVYSDPNDPDSNYHVLGFFSKEKLSWDANNLACILVFPPYQHKQLGKLLMGVSYKISSWERDRSLIGGPERPLSEMGRRSYSRFWEDRVARYLLLHGRKAEDAEDFAVPQKSKSLKGLKRKHAHEFMTVQDIGLATGMLTEDVITALKGLSVVQPATPSKKRKSKDWNEATNAGHGTFVTVRKTTVLEWAKSHHMALWDPVKDEGFHGKWAPTDSDVSDGDSNESGDG